MEKISLTIAGESYNISTDDDLEYVSALAAELDEKIRNTLQTNPRISVTQASVLTALDYADMCKKTEDICETLRSQIQDYLEDAARAKTDAEISRKEAEKLAKEIAKLKAVK